MRMVRAQKARRWRVRRHNAKVRRSMNTTAIADNSFHRTAGASRTQLLRMEVMLENLLK